MPYINRYRIMNKNIKKNGIINTKSNKRKIRGGNIIDEVAGEIYVRALETGLPYEKIFASIGGLTYATLFGVGGYKLVNYVRSKFV